MMEKGSEMFIYSQRKWEDGHTRVYGFGKREAGNDRKLHLCAAVLYVYGGEWVWSRAASLRRASLLTLWCDTRVEVNS